MKCGMLAVLLMMGMAGAVQLNATVSTNTPLAGTNCRLQGGPTYYNIDVSIQNPSHSKTMSISYSYYNSSSDQFEDNGRICDVGIGVTQTCTFKVYTVTGGKNGTDAFPFKIVGWVGDICGDTYCAGAEEYDALLSVTINHYTSVYEQNVLDKLNTAMNEYNTTSAKYAGNCYNTSGLSILQNAYSEISNARAMISVCDLTDALNTENDAINQIRQAEGYTQPTSCTVTPPPENKTNSSQLPPPKNKTTVTPPNNNSNVNLNQTQNSTPSTQNLTGLTSALVKGCIPFFVLAAVLVAAVWSERRINA